VYGGRSSRDASDSKPALYLSVFIDPITCAFDVIDPAINSNNIRVFIVSGYLKKRAA
jgi:hypothetical protein